MSAITFGAKFDLKKLMACKGFAIAWRVRRANCARRDGAFARLEASGGGTTKLMPQRPVLILQGQLELQANEIRRIL